MISTRFSNLTGSWLLWRVVGILVVSLMGCGVMSEANRLGADLDVGVDGLVAGIAGIHIKVSVAIERPLKKGERDAGDSGGDRGFVAPWVFP